MTGVGGGVPCPHCGNNVSGVMDSRPTRASIRRRRKCARCDRRFTTWEVACAEPPDDALASAAQELRELADRLDPVPLIGEPLARSAFCGPEDVAA